MVTKKHPVRKAEAKKRKQVIRAAAAAKPNPFEIRTTKVKHVVANARSTNTTNTARSRSEAVEKVCTR